MSALTKTKEIDQFVELVQRGIDAWIEAGEIVAKNMDDDAEWAEKVNAAHPEISIEMLYAFDRVGRKQLHPKLLLSDGPGVRKLRRLPYQMQEKYLNGSVPVLVTTTPGEWDTLQIDIHNLTPSQASQVFDGDKVRSPQQQRAWIEDQKAKRVAVTYDEPFRVTGRKLVIMEPCQLSAKQLAQILAQME